MRHYEYQLIELIEKNKIIMQILKHLYEVDPLAYIAAGIIRNTVWSNIHETDYELDGTEVDVVFYDPECDAKTKCIQTYMHMFFPNMQWDVTNQALVHTWYKKDNGDVIAPLTSIEHALSLWPETATAVAVRLNAQQQIEYVAPFGLEDLFELKLRWNKTLVSYEGFIKRLESKQFLDRWPMLKLID